MIFGCGILMMKVLVVVGLLCLVVALTADAYRLQEDLDSLDHHEERQRTVKSKYAETSSNKMSAKICKPYFMACKQNAADKAGVRKCFVQFFTGCMQKIRMQLDETEQCISNAGSDFNQVQECISTSVKY